LKETLKQIDSLNIPVVLLQDYPMMKEHSINSMVYSAWNDRDISQFGLTLEEHHQQTQTYLSEFESLKFPNVIIVDPTSYFLNDAGLLSCQDNGDFLYMDDTHLSELGGKKLIPLFEEILDPSVTRTATPGDPSLQ